MSKNTLSGGKNAESLKDFTINREENHLVDTQSGQQSFWPHSAGKRPCKNSQQNPKSIIKSFNELAALSLSLSQKAE